MKNKGRIFAGLVCFSLAVALAGAVVIYRFFPRYLFRPVYLVHESGADGVQEAKNVERNARYAEHFRPTEPYLKSLVLHMGWIGGASADRSRDMAVNMKLLRDDGKILAESILIPETGGLRFQEFSLERWVEPGREYSALITFPDSSDIYVTSSFQDIGPGEHSLLEIGGEAVEETLYMRYVYGTYSKKLLMLWFVAMFAAVFMVGERGIFLLKKD